MTHPNRSRHAGLLALNAAALAALALVSFAPGSATAQNTPAARARGDYTMVSAKITGALESAVYVIDASNSEMIAVKWDSGRKAISGLGFRDLAADIKKPGAKGR